MPRKLPWLDGDSKAATPRPAKRQRIETPTLDDASATPRRAGRQSTLARADRTPSSSPPPQPPSQEFMKDGLSGDDIWIMVEDEFLATANLYTQHLHHAEYHRLKRLARDRAASNNEMFRAVDRRTTMSGETRRILESHQRDSLQSRVLPEVPGWDEADVRPIPEQRRASQLRNMFLPKEGTKKHV
ncbi:hypothetical protein K490DRAFT_55495 [Saccharata proteae CBS 121410]|uniref:Uncharacterized protein n=1 Tax=Saccharata proteae CBS 121410 TaxID=1314787 RepID=A0A6A5YDG0_9PEZI|nr:hypothetical protein K490DRAFT_55495 [Saccharata proteae CBS 121410]